MNPKLVQSGNPIDYELAELLGKKPADFIVLCFDGVQFKNFGTPFDTPASRDAMQRLVNDLMTDRDNAFSDWELLWDGHGANIIKEFNLPADTTSVTYRPVVSYDISRVVVGYSQHVHAACSLLHEIGRNAAYWKLFRTNDSDYSCIITGTDNRHAAREGGNLAMVIAETVRDHLTGATCPPQESREEKLERLLRDRCLDWQQHCEAGILCDESVYLEERDGKKPSYAESLDLLGIHPLT